MYIMALVLAPSLAFFLEFYLVSFQALIAGIYSDILAFYLT